MSLLYRTSCQASHKQSLQAAAWSHVLSHHSSYLQVLLVLQASPPLVSLLRAADTGLNSFLEASGAPSSQVQLPSMFQGWKHRAPPLQILWQLLGD